MGNQRIQVVESDGTSLGQLPVPDPSGILTIANGELYVPLRGDPAVTSTGSCSLEPDRADIRVATREP